MKTPTNFRPSAEYELLREERGTLQSKLQKPFSFDSIQMQKEAAQRFKELTARLNAMYRAESVQ